MKLVNTLFKPSIVKMLIGFVWSLVWGIAYNEEVFGDSEVPMYLGLVGIGHIVIQVLVIIAHAWVINPLRNRKKK